MGWRSINAHDLHLCHYGTKLFWGSHATEVWFRPIKHGGTISSSHWWYHSTFTLLWSDLDHFQTLGRQALFGNSTHT